MLGKTNLLFVAEDEAAELAFKPEYILTSSSGSITKIEYINNLFFVFTNKDEVLYGSDINKLQLIKKDGATFGAKHIIYTNNSYYLADANLETKKAVIYKTTNFSTYEEVVLKNLEDDARVKGLFISSENQIVALIERKLAGSGNDYYYEYDLLTTDSLSNYSEENAIYQNYDLGSISYSATYIPKMKKDRIFALIRHNNYGSGNGYVLSLNGKYNAVTNVYSWFTSDHFFYYGGSSGVVGYPLYYSFNGIDYIRLDFDHIKSFLALNIFEYDGSIAMIYSCEEDGKKVQKFTTSATPKGLIDATKSAIPVSIDYTMISDSELYKDDYVYLGCTGGIIIKGQIDNAEVIRPDVVVVKGMAAMEALRQANDYTDEKYKNTTKEVKEIEETTRQYMENVFSATPEGYAELVDTVHENTVKIGIITEKAELNIKETAMGENIHLIDSADSKLVEFALYGKAKQNTTSGKNLLKNTTTSRTINGVTFTVNSDGSVTANGTAETQVTLVVGEYTVQDNGSYVKSGCPIGGSSSSYWLGGDGISNDYGNGATATLEKGVVIRPIIAIAKSYKADNLTFKPMVRLASITDDTWEPYTGGIPSPNPDYPMDIEVAGSGGSVKIVSCGKNLKEFDLDTIKAQNTVGIWEDNVYKRHDGSLKFNDDGSIEVNGTFSASTTCFIGYIYNLDIKSNYILSGSPYRSDNNAGVNLFRLDIRGSDGMNVRANNHSGESKFTPVEETHTCYIRIEGNVTTDKLIFYPMVSKEGGEYEPYKKTSSVITTENGRAGIPVDSGGNYTDESGQQWICDEIVKYADGSGEYVQQVKKIIFDGSSDELWGKSSHQTNNSYYIDQSWVAKGIAGRKIGMICNRFIEFDVNDIIEKDTVGCSYGSSGLSQIRLGFGLDSEITAVNLLKEWLSSNPVEIVCILSEAIRTPLTEEQLAEIEKLSTFYPVTNISNDSDCGMRITYLADSKNYINRKVAEQVASIVENIK